MNVKKLISIIAVAGIVIATAVGVYVYFKAFTPNTQFSQNEVYVYIPTNSTYEQVTEIVKPLIKDFEKFDFVATSRNYSTNVKAGKFLFKKDMTSLANHFVCIFKVCIIRTLYEILLNFHSFN